MSVESGIPTSPSGIITHVPSVEELRSGLEAKSSMNPIIGNIPWAQDQDKDRAVLASLRDELVFGELNHDRIAALHETARHIGDTELMQADDSDEIGQLLNASAWYAKPQVLTDLEPQEDGKVGSHNESGILRMDLTTLNEVAKDLVMEMDQAGMPLLDRRDAYLASYLHVAAHESAHAILAGISKFEKGRQPSDERRLATKTYLEKHPEEGFTGDWQSDAQIHEERFAEGYAQMVMRSALERLGYSSEHANIIIEKMAPPASEDNEGLGYGSPLPKEQLSAQIKEISLRIKAHNFPTAKSGEQWNSAVAANRATGTPTVLGAEGSEPITASTFEANPNQTRALRRLGGVMLRSLLGRKRR